MALGSCLFFDFLIVFDLFCSKLTTRERSVEALIEIQTKFSFEIDFAKLLPQKTTILKIFWVTRACVPFTQWNVIYIKTKIHPHTKLADDNNAKTDVSSTVYLNKYLFISLKGVLPTKFIDSSNSLSFLSCFPRIL